MAKRQSSRVTFLPTLDTFTIPQGIEALGGVINEIDYRSVRGITWRLLPQHIQHAIDSEYIAHLPVLFFVLIIVERAVLIVHERDNGTIAILDSHSHMQGKKGKIKIFRQPADAEIVIGERRKRDREQFLTCFLLFLIRSQPLLGGIMS
ncbi:unnamed protein product [Strongylus vulgaris]|uniref:Uncharacterized protein n=1 Tax=Strongylus vulgaris TaxID=40348 RepID=A0A3P7I4I9_STRVU|nr:unnamed protein product [Strongylus vulgaris]